MKRKQKINKRGIAFLVSLIMIFSATGSQNLLYAEDIVAETNQGEEQNKIIEQDDAMTKEVITEEVITEEESKPEDVSSDKPATETSTPETSAPEEQPVEGTNSSTPEEQPSESRSSSAPEKVPSLKATGGVLEMSMANGGKFDPAGGKQEVSVIYRPSIGGTNRKIEISGFGSAGLKIEDQPIVSGPITAASYTSPTGTLTVSFSDSFGVGGDISFRFSVDVADEKNFSTGVTKENGEYFGSGLTMTSTVQGAIELTQSSQVPLVTYQMVEDDLQTTQNSQTTDAYSRYSGAMVLHTSPRSAEKTKADGGGWEKKESKYYLSTVSPSFGTGGISKRYIRNLRIEIPLPPNVTFVRSDYESEKNGIRVTGSADGTTVILEKAGHSERSAVEFTMTLDFTTVPTTGGVEQYGVRRWHNFHSNDTQISGRNQSGKPWKFTGDMFGMPQTRTFYDRSAIVLDTLLLTDSRGTLGGVNYDYAQKEEIEINGYDPQGKITSIDIPNARLDWEIDYTRRYILEFDSEIRPKSIRIDYDATKSHKLMFHTNKGRELAQTTKPFTSVVTVPPMETGEYVTKLYIEPYRNELFRFFLTVDLMDTKPDGTPVNSGNIARIRSSFEIAEYGAISEEQSGMTATYVEPKILEPILNRVEHKRDDGRAHFTSEINYENVLLISIENTGAEVGAGVNRKLTEVKVSPEPDTFRVFGTSTDKEIYPPYQVFSNSPATLTLTGYAPTELPEVKITYQTSLGNSREIVIAPNQFHFDGTSATVNVNPNLPDGELVAGVGMEISSMPSWTTASLTLDHMKLEKDTLPSKRNIYTMRVTEMKYAARLIWTYRHIAEKLSYITPNGKLETTSGSGAASHVSFYWDPGLGFDFRRKERRSSDSVRPILPGQQVDLSLYLVDSAYNPTYAFEIDKNFNYIPDSFAPVSQLKDFEFIEEWLPNYFNDPTDTEHYGNGLLRIRFVGSGDRAYNLFPIDMKLNSIGNLDFVPGYYFRIKLQAKYQTPPGIYQLMPYIYRSDVWAESNLIGKEMAFINSDSAPTGHIDLHLRKTLSIRSYYDDSGLRQADQYDIDGNGDKNQLVYVDDLKNQSNLGNMEQQVTKQSSTHVTSYLIDKKTGLEIQDAKIHPHQRVDFVQAMELISAGNGKDFIAYYHIPKEKHKIAYRDENDVEKTYISQYDTYVEDFLKVTVDNAPAPVAAGVEIYYYISPDPSDPDSDDHNEMKELVDGQTDTSPNYKTEAEIRQMATAQSKTVQEILANCTMIKIKSNFIEPQKDIRVVTPLIVGHNESGNNAPLLNYITALYRYTSDTGVRLPTAYTPVTTVTLLPYQINGTLFLDKNADSLLSVLEGGVKDVTVELWNAGKDPHTGAVNPPYQVDTVQTNDRGEFSFIQSHHGEFFVLFKMPNGQALSFKEQSGGSLLDQSVFEMGVHPLTGEEVALLKIELDDKDITRQKAGLVDIRTLTTPQDIYVSVGQTVDLRYQISPDYLMNDINFEVKPTLVSEGANDSIFTTDVDGLTFTGVTEGTGTVTVSISRAPLDGITNITNTVTIHVEPASVGSAGVTTKAQIYAVQGKTDEVIAPDLHVTNYDVTELEVYIQERGPIVNEGLDSWLTFVKQKSTYTDSEIVLNIIPSKRTSPFSGLTKTNIMELETMTPGLFLGTLKPFSENENWGSFTFDGAYNQNIKSKPTGENRFKLHYHFARKP